jgi:hypothetical protein
MFLGSTLAGALSSVMLTAGMERGTAYTASFIGAGVAQLISVGVAFSRQRRNESLSPSPLGRGSG